MLKAADAATLVSGGTKPAQFAWLIMFFGCCMILIRPHARSGFLLAFAMPHDQPASVVALPPAWPFCVGTGAMPTSFFAVRLAAGAPDLIARIDAMLSGGLREPPAWLGSIPLVGKGALEWWQSVSVDPERLRQELRPLAKPIREFLVAAGAGISTGILQFALAIFIAALLSLNGETLAAAVDRIAARLGGERGLRQVAIVRSTVRGVFRGLLGTCAVNITPGIANHRRQ